MKVLLFISATLVYCFVNTALAWDWITSNNAQSCQQTCGSVGLIPIASGVSANAQDYNICRSEVSTGDGKRPGYNLASTQCTVLSGGVENAQSNFDCLCDVRIITPVSASFAGSYYGSPDNVINGSGLSGDGSIENQTHKFISVHENTSLTAPAHEIINNDLILDLGGSYAINEVIFWQYTGLHTYQVTRDIEVVDIYTSTDGANYTLYGRFNLQVSGVGPEIAQVFDLEVTASHVRIDFIEGHGNVNGHGMEYGLGEVRFR